MKQSDWSLASRHGRLKLIGYGFGRQYFNNSNTAKSSFIISNKCVCVLGTLPVTKYPGCTSIVSTALFRHVTFSLNSHNQQILILPHWGLVWVLSL